MPSYLKATSFALGIRLAGLVSRESRIVVACVLAAIPLACGVHEFTGLPDWAGFAVLLAVGVLLPGYLTGRYAGE